MTATNLAYLAMATTLPPPAGTAGSREMETADPHAPLETAVPRTFGGFGDGGPPPLRTIDCPHALRTRNRIHTYPRTRALTNAFDG